MYLIHQHYCNSVSWDNSYVYVWHLNVNNNIQDFIYWCISNCDDETLDDIYKFIVKSLWSHTSVSAFNFNWFKVEIYPAGINSWVTNIVISNEEDGYMMNIIKWPWYIYSDADNLYSSL